MSDRYIPTTAVVEAFTKAQFDTDELDSGELWLRMVWAFYRELGEAKFRSIVETLVSEYAIERSDEWEKDGRCRQCGNTPAYCWGHNP